MQYDSALKLYDAKLKDVASSARMKEKLGKYKEAVTYCCKNRRYDLGLSLTKRFHDEKKLEKIQVSDVAYLQVARCLKANSVNELREWLEFIPNTEQRMHMKKQAGLYEEVFHDLCLDTASEESLTAAFRLASAQHMFSEGIEVAQKHERTKVVANFQLQQATTQIISSNTIQIGLLEDLSKLSELRDRKDLDVASKAKLLLAINEAPRDKLYASKLCREAFSIQCSLMNKIGKLECYFCLQSLQEEKDKQLHSLIKESIDMIQECERLITTLETGPTDQLIMMQIEQFYGLENLGGGIYCIPREQDLWVQTLEKCVGDGETYDSDGMLQLDQAKVFIAIRKHFERYANEWKEGIKPASKTLENTFRLRFSFHNEIQVQHYLKPRRMLSGTDQIRDYITNCELAATIHQIDSECFEAGDPLDPLIDLTSPFPQVVLHFTEEAYKLIAESKALKQSLTLRLNELLKKPKPSSSELLTFWRLSGILGKGKEMAKKFTEQRSRLDKSLNKKSSADYRFDKVAQCHEHYFSYWLESCQCLRSGNRAFTGIRTSTSYFLKFLALRKKPAISVQNLVSILSVHTTTLLAMLSYEYYQQDQYQQTVVPLPETFQRFVRSFHMINCQRKVGIGIQHSALETASSMKDVGGSVHKLLLEFLQLLLGRRNDNSVCSSPLQQAIQDPVQLQSGEALHCLILTLTIYGNLVLINKPTKNSFLPEVHKIVTQYLEAAFSFSEEFAIPFQNAYKNVKQSKTTQDIFGKVISRLLADTLEMSVKQIKTIKYRQIEQIEFKPCQSDKILSIPLPTHLLDSNIDKLSTVTTSATPSATVLSKNTDKLYQQEFVQPKLNETLSNGNESSPLQHNVMPSGTYPQQHSGPLRPNLSQETVKSGASWPNSSQSLRGVSESSWSYQHHRTEFQMTNIFEHNRPNENFQANPSLLTRDTTDYLPKLQQTGAPRDYQPSSQAPSNYQPSPQKIQAPTCYQPNSLSEQSGVPSGFQPSSQPAGPFGSHQQSPQQITVTSGYQQNSQHLEATSGYHQQTVAAIGYQQCPQQTVATSGSQQSPQQTVATSGSQQSPQQTVATSGSQQSPQQTVAISGHQQSPRQTVATSSYQQNPQQTLATSGYQRSPQHSMAPSGSQQSPRQTVATSSYQQNPQHTVSTSGSQQSSQQTVATSSYQQNPQQTVSTSGYQQNPQQTLATSGYQRSPQQTVAPSGSQQSPRQTVATSSYQQNPQQTVSTSGFQQSPRQTVATSSYQQNPQQTVAISGHQLSPRQTVATSSYQQNPQQTVSTSGSKQSPRQTVATSSYQQNPRQTVAISGHQQSPRQTVATSSYQQNPQQTVSTSGYQQNPRQTVATSGSQQSPQQTVATSGSQQSPQQTVAISGHQQSPRQTVATSSYQQNPQQTVSTSGYQRSPQQSMAPSGSQQSPRQTVATSSYQQNPQHTVSTSGFQQSSQQTVATSSYQQNPQQTVSTSGYQQNPQQTLATSGYQRSPQQTVAPSGSQQSPRQTVATSSYQQNPQQTVSTSGFQQSPRQTVATSSYQQNPQQTVAISGHQQSPRQTVATSSYQQNPQQTVSTSGYQQNPQQTVATSGSQQSPQQTVAISGHQQSPRQTVATSSYQQSPQQTVAISGHQQRPQQTVSTSGSQQSPQQTVATSGSQQSPQQTVAISGHQQRPRQTVATSSYQQNPQQTVSTSGYQQNPRQTVAISGHQQSPRQTVATSSYQQNPQQTVSTSGYQQNPQQTVANSGYQQSPQQSMATSGYQQSPQQTVATSGSQQSPLQTVATSSYQQNPQHTVSTSGYQQNPQQTVATSGYQQSPQQTVATSGSQQSPQQTVATSGYQRSPQQSMATSSYQQSPQQTVATSGYQQNPQQRMASPQRTMTTSGYQQSPQQSMATSGYQQSPQQTVATSGSQQSPQQTVATSGYQRSPQQSMATSGYQQNPQQRMASPQRTMATSGYQQSPQQRMASPQQTVATSGFQQSLQRTVATSSYQQNPQGTMATSGYQQSLRRTVATSGFQLQPNQAEAHGGYQQHPQEPGVPTVYQPSPQQTSSPSNYVASNSSEQTKDSIGNTESNRIEVAGDYQTNSQHQTVGSDNYQSDIDTDNSSDEEDVIVVDDDDDDDLIQERMAIAQANKEKAEDIDTEDYPADDSSVHVLYPGFCLVCHTVLGNIDQFKYHQVSDYHIAQTIFYEQYLKAKESNGFDHHIRNLMSSIVQCQQQGLHDVNINQAYVEAESLCRYCSNIDRSAHLTSNWQAGARDVTNLSSRLISATIELQRRMVDQKQRLMSMNASS